MSSDRELKAHTVSAITSVGKVPIRRYVMILVIKSFKTPVIRVRVICSVYHGVRLVYHTISLSGLSSSSEPNRAVHSIPAITQWAIMSSLDCVKCFRDFISDI